MTVSIPVLFWCLIYMHNILKKLASFICTYFINFKFNVCIFVTVTIGVCSTWYFEDLFSYREWTQPFTQKCVTNFQTYLGNQLNNFWTWNNSMLMKYHTGDSAERLELYEHSSGVKGLVPRDLLHLNSLRRQCYHQIITIIWNGRY